MNLKEYFSDERRIAFLESMYLTHKVGTTYPPIEINSLPFPQDNLLPIIETNEFFIEMIEHTWFLRHINNHYFCVPVWSYKKEITSLELDINDNPVEVKKELMNHYVYFDGTPLSVGYRFNEKEVFFLHTDRYTSDPVTLAPSQPNLFELYMAAKLGSKRELENSTKRFRNLKFKNYLTQNNLQPKGEWEQEQFNTVFGGNPFVLTDDEFEMIFGVEKP
jgi:hypothetical protein